MGYLWTENINPPRFPKLCDDLKTDVLIIGGGMAGILCARLLRDKGVDCMLTEAKTIGMGITKGTTAVLTAQHSTLYTDLISSFGIDKAKQYLNANLEAVNKFRELSKTIPCEFEDKPSIMYSRYEDNRLEDEAETLQKLGLPAEYIKQTLLPFNIAGAVLYPRMAQFHPLKFLSGAANGLNIYENTMVRRVEGTVAYTDSAKITARKIIIATHFPFVNRRGLYFVKLYQTRSFVIALENAPDLCGTYTGTSDDDMYFRNYKNLLLVGGGDRRTGTHGGGFEAVRDFVRQYYPDAKIKYMWAAQDCTTLDGVPYIGQYSPATPDIFVATGFNEWGMTSSMAAAAILTDMITGRVNENASVFAPDRSMLHKQLFVNLGTTLGNFILPITKRCPHMGCPLKWNSEERTWDCPCHGSRFDSHGKLIDNPAMRESHVE